MSTKRTHIVFPEDLANEIDRLVGKRQRSRFLTQVAWAEVKRRRLLQALQEAAGSWKDNDHPELKQGAYQFVRKLRQESEERFRRSNIN